MFLDIRRDILILLHLFYHTKLHKKEVWHDLKSNKYVNIKRYHHGIDVLDKNRCLCEIFIYKTYIFVDFEG